MVTARLGHTATRLEDGRVLVVGGCSSALNCNSSAEIYNPNLNTWATVTSMGFARKNHAAVLLLDGTVMVTGGYNYGSPLSTYYKSTEIYDPLSNSWTTKDSMLGSRSEHFAVVRRDGKVVVAGGVNDPLIGDLTILSSAEIYDPLNNTWTSSNPLWFTNRDATAILDPYDPFILMGGRDFGTRVDGANYVQSRDIDIDTEDWAPHEFPDFSPARYNHASIQLATGALLTAGGEGRIDGALQFLNSTVIYQDMDGTAYSYPNTLGNGAVFSAGTFLPNGDILITGGTGNILNEFL
jgi:N-acetylneuraminic acid mutarotase